MLENSACDTDSTLFNVRYPPDYRKYKKKDHLNQLYKFITMDCFNTNKKLINIGQYFSLPKSVLQFYQENNLKIDTCDLNPTDLNNCESNQLAANNTIPAWLIINIMLPEYGPSYLVGSKGPGDGKGWNIVTYYKLSNYGRNLLDNAYKQQSDDQAQPEDQKAQQARSTTATTTTTRTRRRRTTSRSN